MVKEMSLRVRGKSELARLTKKRKAKKEVIPCSEELNQDASERPIHYDTFDSPSDYEEPLPMNWDSQDHEEDGESLVDNFVSDNSMFNSISKAGKATSSISSLEIEIQDSELDDTEILDWTNGDLLDPLERNWYIQEHVYYFLNLFVTGPFCFPGLFLGSRLHTCQT